MVERTASCSCGQLRATCEGDPIRVSLCHCLECQKRTGAPFGTQARWPREKVKMEGRSTAWSRTGDEGGVAEFHFCPVCSSIVWWTFPAMPETIAVPVGAFADPDFPKPIWQVYEGRRHHWLTLDDIPIYSD